MDWIHREDEMPPKGKRILIYTPQTKTCDPSMEYRVIDSQFFKILDDAIFWKLLTPPIYKNKSKYY